MEKTLLSKGQRVYWHDPESGLSSGFYEVLEDVLVDDYEDIVLIGNKYSEAEVYYGELDVE